MLIVVDSADLASTPDRPYGIQLDPTVEPVWFATLEDSEQFLREQLPNGSAGPP